MDTTYLTAGGAPLVLTPANNGRAEWTCGGCGVHRKPVGAENARAAANRHAGNCRVMPARRETA
ncbi:hypothetical protein [Streptomyces sp. NPDC054784]